MPDQDQSTPAPIPRIDPTEWEEHEGFRETLLRHFTDPEANTTLRRLGDLFLTLSLECALRRSPELTHLCSSKVTHLPS